MSRQTALCGGGYTDAMETVRTGPSAGQTVTTHPGRKSSRHRHCPSGSCRRRAAIPRPRRFTAASFAVQSRKNSSAPISPARRRGGGRSSSTSTPTGSPDSAHTAAPRLWLRLK